MIAHLMLPELRYAVRQLRRLLVRLRDWVRGETDGAFFDVRDVRQVNAVLQGNGHRPITANPHEADIDEAGAMRFVLGLLASRRLLRWRFPKALTDGADGRFARWVTTANLGLSAAGRENVRKAFAADPGLRVKRVFELREDLRGAFPLALTPRQRGEYLNWLGTFGRADFKLTPEAAVWFLTELDEEPSRGLAATYRLQPLWQAAVPHGLTRFGWDELKAWVRARYDIPGRWLRTAELADPFGPWDELQFLLAARPELANDFPRESAETGNPSAVVAWAKRLPQTDRAWRKRLADEVRAGLPARTGVNVIGLFLYTSGLQQAVRGAVDALDRAGVRRVCRDFPVPFLREPADRTAYDGLDQFPVTVLNTGIDVTVGEAYQKSGLYPRPGVYRVGIWWWELETVPDRWLDRGQGVDEIWAPTTFIADAMRTAFGRPVFPMPPGVTLSAFDPLPKAHFGLDPRRYTFLYAFDMNSRLPRKNPLGLIRAFRAAFDRKEPIDLVLKVSPPESYYQEQWRELRDTAAAAGVTLLDRTLSRAEMLGLMNAADCYVSLHRSEGFGLTCAEAMLMGKPVVATGYSGNVDFMTAENSYLVRYTRVTLDEDIDPYPKGAVWAAPDEAHAAELLRRVYDRPAEARAVGERAKRQVAELLSPDAAGRRMAARLAEIRRTRPPAHG